MNRKEYYPEQFKPANFSAVYSYCDMLKMYNLSIAEMQLRDPRLIADVALFRICTEVMYEKYLGINRDEFGPDYDPYDEYYDDDEDN